MLEPGQGQALGWEETPTMREWSQSRDVLLPLKTQVWILTAQSGGSVVGVDMVMGGHPSQIWDRNLEESPEETDTPPGQTHSIHQGAKRVSSESGG